MMLSGNSTDPQQERGDGTERVYPTLVWILWDPTGCYQRQRGRSQEQVVGNSLQTTRN